MRGSAPSSGKKGDTTETFRRTIAMPDRHFPSPLCPARSRPTRLARRAAGLGMLAAGLGAALGAPPPARAQAPVAAAAPAHAFDIPAGPLQPGLERFASAAGVNLSYDPGRVAGLSTPGLKGDYTVPGGLRALLAGTGLEAVSQDGGGYVLRPLPRGGEISTLPSITVAGARPGDTPPPYAGGQVASGGRLGMLGNRDLMDAPFSIASYTAENIENQQAASIADALASDPSVRATGMRGSESESFMIRGFLVDTSDIAVNGLYGIAPTYRSSAEYAERIEVVRGPTALLGGVSPSGTSGGGINIVPKRAGDEPLTRLTAGYASDAQAGGHLDMGRRFGRDNRFGIRFNGVYRNGDTGVDRQSRERGLGSLGLDYRGSRLRLSADLIYQQENFDALTRAFTLAAGVGLPRAPAPRRNLAQSWEYSRMNNQSAMARAEYDFSDRLTGYASVGAGRGLFKTVTGNPQIIDGDGDTRVSLALAKFQFYKHSADAGLRASFDTGPVSHEATLSATTYTERQGYAFSFGPALDSNLYDPATYPAYDFAPVGDVPTLSRQQLTSVALADTLSVLDGKAQLTAGVRHQRVKTANYDAATGDATGRYDKDALTPMAGLVLRPWDGVAFYANYIEGLSPGDTAPMEADNAGQAFSPYRSRQYEIGAKYDSGTFGATLSLFQITRPSGSLGPDNVFSVNGRQRNRGIELTAFGEAARGLRVLGGVAVHDARITRSPEPGMAGKRAVGVPAVQANLGVEWDAPWPSGLTLTGMAVYTGRQYLDDANRVRLPSWTRLDAGLRYRTEIASHRTVFRFAVQNLLGRDYWAGATTYNGLYSGAPRTYLLSATVDF